MTDPAPRLKRVSFRGLRTATSVDLDLDGLTVLIGPNGVGKSTLIEGMELLPKISSGDDFLRSVHDDHGGAKSLVSHGSNELGLLLEATSNKHKLTYAVALVRSQGGLAIAEETFAVNGEPRLDRRADTATTQYFNEHGLEEWINHRVKPRQAALSALSGFVGPDMLSLVEGIDVHTAFHLQPMWTGRDREQSPRGENIVQATSRLARGGANLPNAIHTLRNRDDWQDTLETIRLVVDEDIRDVMTPASASGGSIGLAVKYRTGTVPAFALSDGTLALLSLVAITALDGGDPPRSLLVLDEPDLHLHPTALRYVVSLLEKCAEKYPVVIATHSDQLLDCLSDPARSTVLCDLDAERHLRLTRPDAEKLAKWLPEYRGVGQLRAEGYSGLVFPPPPAPIKS